MYFMGGIGIKILLIIIYVTILMKKKKKINVDKNYYHQVIYLITKFIYINNN